MSQTVDELDPDALVSQILHELGQVLHHNRAGSDSGGERWRVAYATSQAAAQLCAGHDVSRSWRPNQA